MAVKTVTGKVTGVDGAARTGTVRAVISAATNDGTNEIVASAVTVATAGDGTYSLTLQANADLTPSTTYYLVTETAADGGTYQFKITVPQTAGPFVISNLLI